MANQSINSPRFFIDFTQLARIKGYYYWEDGVKNVNKISNDQDEFNNNIWNFDFYKPQTYTSTDTNPDFYFYLNQNRSFSRLVSQSNWAGFFNHNFSSTIADSSTIKIGMISFDGTNTSEE